MVTLTARLLGPCTEPKADAKSYAQSVAEWMSPLDFNQKQADIFERREGHTGQWFLEDQTFKEWEAGEIGPLWCHGIRKNAMFIPSRLGSCADKDS